MDRQQARNIIKETFEQSFNKNRFTAFIKNLLNRIEEAPFTYQGQFIPDAYKPYISILERIGKFSDGENRIDILTIKLKKETSLERARTMQRNFIAWYLNGSRGGELKDAALVAFVSPDQIDWRFSIVRMDYKFEETKTGKIKIKEEFTPARRWSFLVGANERSHTAQSRLVNILANDMQAPTFVELEEAFNIETVTKEFFHKYRDLFVYTKEALDKVVKNDARIKADFEAKGVNTVDFVKKLLGQVVFLYFLQKKGWFGVGLNDDWGTGSKQFLRELFEKKHGEYKNFFNDILEPLFYEALRNDRSHDDDYYSRFNCKIPFLNGGLFDPIGNYDWVQTDIYLPNTLFSNNNKTKEGDTGDGILDIFDRFNFTVKEDEPLEKEVAIDPELLGKAYEKFNAIRPDNFEEYKKALNSGKKGDESKFNKQFGVYYTPREIVHYMCQQSLINYLTTELKNGIIVYEKFGEKQLDMFGNRDKKGQLDLTIEHRSNPTISKEDLETLIYLGEQVGENEARVESKGKETRTYSYKLPESIRINAEQIDRKLADITVCDPAVGSGAFPVGMMSEIVKARNILSVFMENKNNLSNSPALSKGDEERFERTNGTSYDFKRRCIEHSLYGVDIDPGAIEIAKLRLWLSLVVDEEDIKNIKPLPNLDYKIVCGNSLLGVKKNLFNNQLFSDLEKVKPLYFNETIPTKKQKLKRQIDDLISRITNGHKEFDFEVYFSEVFHYKGGFDVVIANPPYYQLQYAGFKFQTVKNLYQTYEATGDIYPLFIEKAIQILKNRGVLTYIVSNRFCNTNYGTSTRKLLSRYVLKLLLKINMDVFDEANVGTVVLLANKESVNDNNSICIYQFEDAKELKQIYDIVNQKAIKSLQQFFTEKQWIFKPNAVLRIKEKIDKAGQPFVSLKDIKINRGITTSANDIFIIDESLKEQFIRDNPKNIEILKPVLKGAEIKRYTIIKPNNYLIFSYTGIKIDNYKEIYNYLKKYKNKLLQVYEAKKGQKKWYELRKCSYYSDFEKEKLIWTRLSNINAFAISENYEYSVDSTSFATGKNLKYYCAVLNSKAVFFYFKLGSVIWGKDGIKWFGEYFDNIPIPIISELKQKPFIEIVDKILTITQSDDYMQNPIKQAKVKKYENQIDLMVYELYGLTEDEIKIVEDSK